MCVNQRNLSFERVCLWHISQIKQRLGISGILTNEYTWRCLPDQKPGRKGTQIDLLIDRSDGIIDICEMKYSKEAYSISEAYERELISRKSTFREVTHTTRAIHTVLVTTCGLVRNAHIGEVQNEVVLDDLFL
ncbi:MAG: hypothetical protein ACI30I_06530 [Parabacteroides sp.]